MARVRIEIWDNGDNIQQAEAEHIDPREAFERAVRMARAALPEEKKGPLLDAGSYTFEMKNVQFTEVNHDLLFGGHVGPPNSGFDVKVTSDGPPRKPCETPCPDEDCGDRCARPVLHDGQHSTADGDCIWDRRDMRAETAQEVGREGCPEMCGFTTCWANCQRPKDHKGDHRCDRPKDHERCLNEIGAPSATRNCQQPLNHDGLCDGEQEEGDCVAGMRD